MGFDESDFCCFCSLFFSSTASSEGGADKIRIGIPGPAAQLSTLSLAQKKASSKEGGGARER